MLPERHISQLLTRSHGLGGTIFDIDHEPEKYNENEGRINFDNLDVRLIHSMANGGAKKTLVELSDELGSNPAVIKYRKQQLIKNGYFLYFVAQPGEAFNSMKIAYHVFSLSRDINIEDIKGLPRCVVAYSGSKCVTVIQLSLSFNDYLEYSNILIRRLEPYTTELRTFFVDKPIILNRLSESLFYKSTRKKVL